MLRFLVEIDHDPIGQNSRGQTAFDIAVTDEVFYALDGIDQAYFMIKDAAIPGNCDLIMNAISNGADVLFKDRSKDNYNFVHHLVWNDEPQCIEDTLLLIENDDVTTELLKMENLEGDNPLLMAYNYGATECEAAIWGVALELGITDELE